MTEILCPSCSKRLRVNPQSKARRMRCPVCQAEMALSVSGESVTAKLLSAPVPEPPPLAMPPVPPPMPVSQQATAEASPSGFEEPPPVAVADQPAAEEPAEHQPVIQLSSTPRTSTRSTSAGSTKSGKKASPADSQSMLWIGGGIAVVLVAILSISGFLMMSGAFRGNGKTAAQAPKSAATKKKVPAKEKEVEETEPPSATTPVAETPDIVVSETDRRVPPPLSTDPLKSFPPAADFSPPETTIPDETFTGPLPVRPDSVTTPKPGTASIPEKPAEKPVEKPEPEKPAPEIPAAEKPEPSKPAKTPPEKSKPAKAAPKTAAQKADAKKLAAKGPAPATADCDVCRGRGLVPLKKPQPYVWMEGQPVPKGANAVREQYCPNCKPDADNAELAAAEDLRLKTAMDVHLDWEKKTSWQLVRAETRRATIHSQLPPNETQRVALAIEAMNQHIEGLTGSLELTNTTPANCNIIVLFQKPNYLQFVNLLKADPVLGPSRQDWSLVGEVAGSWVKDTIFYRYVPDGPPPDHQAIALLSSFQIRTATGYKDPAWLNVGYATYCENATLKANRVTSLEYAINNLQIDPDWSQAVHRLAAAGGLKPWNDMFPKILRDYQAEDHLTAYAMVSFLIQYKPQKFLDFIKEIKGGLGAAEALEKAYGEKVPELQQRWVKALGGR